MQPPLEKKGWYRLTGVLKPELITEDGKTVIGYQSWPLKVSAGDASRLQPRLLEAADNRLKQELSNSLIGFVTRYSGNIQNR